MEYSFKGLKNLEQNFYGLFIHKNWNPRIYDPTKLPFIGKPWNSMPMNNDDFTVYGIFFWVKVIFSKRL